MKRGLAALMAAILLGALLAAGCGVPLDDHARAIDRATTTTTSTTTSTTPDSPSVDVIVYYVDEKGKLTEKGGLVPDRVEVSEDPTVRQALTILFTGEVPDQLKTSIPKGTDVISVTPTGSQVAVDLTGEINDVTGDSQKAAYAQMVFTVLAFTEFTSVKFSIEGNPVEAPTDGANRSVVFAEDYQQPLNPG